jgi:hypothetical protein
MAQALGLLKRVPRTGWVLRGVSAPESVAEHSYRMASLCFALPPALDDGTPIDRFRYAFQRKPSHPHLLHPSSHDLRAAACRWLWCTIWRKVSLAISRRTIAWARRRSTPWKRHAKPLPSRRTWRLPWRGPYGGIAGGTCKHCCAAAAGVCLSANRDPGPVARLRRAPNPRFLPAAPAVLAPAAAAATTDACCREPCREGFGQV